MEQTEKEDVINILSSLNLKFGDFVFKEIDLTSHETFPFYATSRELEVTYKQSQISKKYKIGHGSSWVAEFGFDIQSNFYRTRQ